MDTPYFGGSPGASRAWRQPHGGVRAQAAGGAPEAFRFVDPRRERAEAAPFNIHMMHATMVHVYR